MINFNEFIRNNLKIGEMIFNFQKKNELKETPILKVIITH